METVFLGPSLSSPRERAAPAWPAVILSPPGGAKPSPLGLLPPRSAIHRCAQGPGPQRRLSLRAHPGSQGPGAWPQGRPARTEGSLGGEPPHPAFLMSHPVPASLPAGRRRAPHPAREPWRGPLCASRPRAFQKTFGSGAARRPGGARRRGRGPRPARRPALRGPRGPGREPHAERRLRAAQPARHRLRALRTRGHSRRRRRARGAGARPRPRSRRPASTQAPHASTAEVAARHATGPEAPQPPPPHPDGHRTHPSMCVQRHFPPARSRSGGVCGRVLPGAQPVGGDGASDPAAPGWREGRGAG